MDNDKFQELMLQNFNKVFKRLDGLESNQQKLTIQLTGLLYGISEYHKETTDIKRQSKRTIKPYYDLDAMDRYCNENCIHPGDLSGEEMKKFKLR